MSKRHGPQVLIRYRCDGCAHHQVKRDDPRGNDHLCAAPAVVEEYGAPQWFGNWASTPPWCPFRGDQ